MDGERKVLAMTEDQLLAAVLELCKYLGARTMHIRPARTLTGWKTPVQGDGKGFPDLLVITKDHRLLFRELKTDRGNPTREQREWLEALKTAGLDAGVWRPADLSQGRVKNQLAPIRRTAWQGCE